MIGTKEQRAAVRAGAGISELARKFGMAYGDAGRLVDEIRNEGARLADDSRCGVCGGRSCGCGAQYQREQAAAMKGP